MKLNTTIYNKLVLQAQEAKEVGLTKLADGVISSVGATSRDPDEFVTYSSIELHRDIYNNLWKIALDVIKHHDLESVDIQKIDDALKFTVAQVLRDIEMTLEVNDKIGLMEPKLPGESK